MSWCSFYSFLSTKKRLNVSLTRNHAAEDAELRCCGGWKENEFGIKADVSDKITKPKTCGVSVEWPKWQKRLL